jgi:protein gp37
MNRTKNIEWVQNPDGSPGYTWNPITGCLNHDNGLCKGGDFPCYAYRLAHGRLKQRYLANYNYGDIIQSPYEKRAFTKLIEDRNNDPFFPRFWEDRANEDLGICRGIFVCDMSDLFGIGIPTNWTRQVLDAIRRSSHRNRYYLLTKQPQNLAKFSPLPDHCWVGVTCTSKRIMNHNLPLIMNVGARIKYISFEPLLVWDDHSAGIDGERLLDAGVDWVIIGAQTKPYKPPKIEWVKEIVDACDKARIPVFLKDNLVPLFRPLMRVPNIAWWGNVFGLRQKLPK